MSNLTQNVDLSGLEPADLGIVSDRFYVFRDVQKQGIEHILFGPNGDGGRSVVACGAPTGSGKTGLAVGAARAAWEWRGWRTAILTATRALEEQYLAEFPILADVRGRNNYECSNGWTCKEGGDSEDRCSACQEIAQQIFEEDGERIKVPLCVSCKSHCPYRGAVEHAASSPVVLTNYQYWLNVRGMNADALGQFQMVVCDEAHEAIGELGRYLGAWTSHKDLRTWSTFLFHGESGEVNDRIRRGLAEVVLAIRRDLPDVPERGRKTAAAKRLEDLLKNVERVVDLSDDGPWLWQMDRGGVRFDPVWPGRYAPRYLMRGMDKTVLVSATLRPKTLGLMGLARGMYDFREWPRQFPPQYSPVYYWGVARMKHGDAGDWPRLVQAVNDIAFQRCDRKGIIHTVSYDRAKALSREISTLLPAPILCERGKAQEAADRLRKADAGTVLITPSHGTGFDFPATDCEYQIIVKLPFGNTSDPLEKARAADDGDYGLYETMQDLVQMCGRATRHDTDRSETFVLDRAFPFLWARAKQFAPTWFRTYDIQAVPKKPPKL